jgi:ATP-dependent RNA helicase DDX35
MMSDPLLSRYSVVMLDEAHERSLCTDVVIGLLKKIQRRRPELRIIVTSATLDAEKVRDFFALNESGRTSDSDVAILSIEGRTFPVDIFYAVDPVPDYVKASVETVMKIHSCEPPGDVLCFLTGQEDINSVVRALIDESRKLPRDAMRMRVLPMHGGLPASDQLRVFERVSRGTRKVVVATNIAEASVTIDGIVYVVDAGFVKIPAYDSSSGIETLVVTSISQASAEQRAGRAGRVRSGKVCTIELFCCNIAKWLILELALTVAMTGSALMIWRIIINR